MRAIITGAAGGIGGATAEALLAAGDLHLVAADIDEARLSAAAKELRDAGATVVESVGDVAEAAYCEHVVRQAQDAFGGLDALVSNAGVLDRQPLLELDLSAWERTFAVNARAMWLLARAAFPLLREARGSVVATASIAGHHPSSPHGAYSASKAALLMLVRQLAHDWGPDGVRVNSVSPGMVVTDMTATYYGTPEQRRRRSEHIPLGDIADAGEIAAVIAFLAGPQARYVTGQDVVVDGGVDTKLLSTFRALSGE